MTDKSIKNPHVGLFITCLANTLRPSVGFASVALLKAAGCEVSVPLEQTCCSQPGYNPGDVKGAAKQAKIVIKQFESFDYVVAPSGSCAGMIKNHYAGLFDENDPWHQRAITLSQKTFELTQFLFEVIKVTDNPTTTSTTNLSDLNFTYHDSCACKREMAVGDAPRALLKSMVGARPKEMEETDVCCGFGGSFAVKMPDISLKMADDKLNNAAKTEADVLVSADLGCLIHLAGRAANTGQDIEFRHIAELLADRLRNPSIGKEASSSQAKERTSS